MTTLGIRKVTREKTCLHRDEEGTDILCKLQLEQRKMLGPVDLNNN